MITRTRTTPKMEKILKRLWGGIHRITQKIIGTLIFTLAFLIFAYVVTLAVLAIGQLYLVTNFYKYYILQSDHRCLGYSQNVTQINNTQNSTLQSAFLDGSVFGGDIFYLITITALLLVMLLVISIFRDETSTTILPFKVCIGYEKYSGEAVSDMLLSELKRIRQIHRTKYEGIEPGKIPLKETALNWTPPVTEYLTLPQIKPKTENLTYNIAELGTVSTGLVSISLGHLLIILKDLCPFSNPGTSISGSLQKYGSTICLVAHYSGPYSWTAHHKIKVFEGAGHEIIPDIVRDLSFKIAQELSPEHSAKNWESFKYFTKALDNYRRYILIEDTRALEHALKNCLKAISIEQDYDQPIRLLYNLGIAYLNNNKYYEAERTFRQILMFKRDSGNAWHGLGKALRRLHQHEEAIKCYDEALEITKSEAEAKATLTSKGHSLRHLENYYGAYSCFKRAIEIDENYALAWAGKGLVCGCLAEKEKDQKKKEKSIEGAIKAYEKAIELDPDEIMWRPALARLYQKRNKKDDREKSNTQCNIVHKSIEHLSEYNRSCFEAICGDVDEALKWLEMALKYEQVTTCWIKKDPDLEFILNDSRFTKLMEKYGRNQKSKDRKAEEIKARISNVAIHRMLKYKIDYIDKECREIRKDLETENEYVQACYYSVCGDVDKALEMLRIALVKKQASPEKPIVDPDLISIRGNSQFWDLMDEFTRED